MRLASTLFGILTALCVLAVNVQAADKEVTLKGKILCGKCTLKQAKKCATVIKVKEDGKDMIYWFLENGNKEEYHEEVCGGGEKEGTVTGTVSEKDGKKWIKPKDVKYVK